MKRSLLIAHQDHHCVTNQICSTFFDFQVENSGRLVFKPWERRLDKTECVESDADEELLINIPFTGDVKLKGLIVIGGEDDTHPDKVGIYLNP